MPTETKAEAARELLDSLGTSSAAERGVAVLPNGQFVDRAMIEGAERLIALAARRAPTPR
jgi:citrate lyase subunit beta/citryl-CoA lyase